MEKKANNLQTPGGDRQSSFGKEAGEAHTRPQKSLVDEAAFMRRVIRGLEMEWCLAADVLSGDLRQRFHVPGFSLMNTKRMLGQWAGAPVREIRIAARLVVEHPWYAVVEVLKHEMAHQLAEEVLGGGVGPAHGAAFARACGMLGVSPDASRAAIPLDELVLGRRSGERPAEAVTRRVQKLLALAGSPNRNEAERAMAKAHELMLKHNLDRLRESEPSGEYHSIRAGRPALRHPLDSQALASLLRDYYFVRTIWVPTYIFDRERVGRALEICGTRGNVQLAVYVHDYVSRYIAAEWRARAMIRPGRNGRRDFALGVIRGFREVLDRQTATAAPAVQALVRVGDAALDDYFAYRHPRIRQVRRGRGVRVSADLFQAGEEAGGRLVIRRGITATAGNRGRLLGRSGTAAGA